jgi:hypothetical protein
MLFFAFIPALMLAANMAVRWRYKAICDMRDYELNTALSFELRCRYKIRTYYNYLAQMGDVYVELTPDILALRTDLRERIITLMATGRDRFPESTDLHLFIAQFYVDIEFNRVFAYRELQQLQDTSSWLDIRFRALMLQRQVVQASNLQKSDQVRAYVEFRKHTEVVDGELILAMRSLIQFWSELLHPDPQIEKLAVTGTTARAHLAQVTALLEQMLVLHPLSLPTMRLYALLCMQVLGDNVRAEELLDQAEKVEQLKRHMVLDTTFGDFMRVSNRKQFLDIFDEDNCVLTVSLRDESFGIVEEANSTVMKTLGYGSVSSLVGGNVDKVCTFTCVHLTFPPIIVRSLSLPPSSTDHARAHGPPPRQVHAGVYSLSPHPRAGQGPPGVHADCSRLPAAHQRLHPLE